MEWSKMQVNVRYIITILLSALYFGLIMFEKEKNVINAFHHSRGSRTSRSSTTTSSPLLIQNSFQLVQRQIVKDDLTLNNYQQLIISKCLFSSRPRRTRPLFMDKHQHMVNTGIEVALIRNDPVEQIIPSNMSSAVRRFFFGKDHGPLLIVLAICALIQMRLGNFSFLFDVISSSSASAMGPLTINDALGALFAVVFWCFQEHVIHQKMLHSKLGWIGKTIHERHHNNPYFTISIDPPFLIIGWLVVVFVALVAICPTLPEALSCMIGYSVAGLAYEWTHYIVHTRVKSKNPFFRQLRDNHMRHHLVDQQYWYAFILPQMDSLFGTNPNVKDVKANKSIAITSNNNKGKTK